MPIPESAWAFMSLKDCAEAKDSAGASLPIRSIRKVLVALLAPPTRVVAPSLTVTEMVSSPVAVAVVV